MNLKPFHATKDNGNRLQSYHESILLKNRLRPDKPLLIFLALFFWTNSLFAADTKGSNLINCNIQQTACIQQLAGSKITFDVHPKPVKAMKDLRFQLSIVGKQPDADPYIDLGMPGMDMGPNRVELKPTGNGVFEGKGIIVRCPSGRRTWSAKVTLPGCGMVEFIFDVIY
jgi:hypothetical protein